MITVGLAKTLRDNGLRWNPARGDRFVIADRDMDDEVFVLSDMTVDVHRFPTGAVLGFNGTVEWALDAIEARDAVWLPRESQLREALAGTFRSLERAGEVFRISVQVNGEVTHVEHEDVEQAYGLALLHLVAGDD